MSRKHRRRDARAGHPSRKREAGSARGERPARTGRLWLFRAIAVALPFALLGLVEGGLRLAGYGKHLEPLFVAAPGHPDYLQANPRAVLRFFADPAQAPSVSIETAYFKAMKPPHSFRLVVQGESSTAGFPYGLGASLAGMLEQRLKRSYPDREIEVIQTAMAAVNSYALLDFADEIIAQQPDAVLIYVGHNEYLGILGVGSTLRFASAPWITRTVLAVREWRLFQLMQQTMGGLGMAAPDRLSTAGDSLMARVAGERSIALDSPLFERGVAQFEHNLDALLARYAAEGIAVYIGTLASNERDQRPFAGEAARATYQQARELETEGDFHSARNSYLRAKDFDELRFRAPEVFGAVIRRLAARRGATVVDVQTRLAAASRNGIIGAELMLEHVHPNLRGYFFLADAYFEALTAGQLPTPPVIIPDEQSLAEMPVSDIDRLLGEYKIRKVLASWPFAEAGREPGLPPAQTEGERLAQALYRQQIDWPTAQDRLRQYYRRTGNFAEYSRISQILADAFPFVPTLQFDAGTSLIELERPRDALRYTRRAVELAGNTANFLLAHGHALALTRRREEARATLERVLTLDPHNATAQLALEQLGRSEQSVNAEN